MIKNWKLRNLPFSNTKNTLTEIYTSISDFKILWHSIKLSGMVRRSSMHVKSILDVYRFYFSNNVNKTVAYKYIKKEKESFKGERSIY